MDQIDCSDFKNSDKDAEHDWSIKPMMHFNPTPNNISLICTPCFIVRNERNLQRKQILLWSILYLNLI